MIIRQLIHNDYDNGVIELLSQLTTISKKYITKSQFENFVLANDNNNHHQIYVIDMIDPITEKHTIIGHATLLIEPKLIHNLSFVGHIEDVVIDSKHRGTGLGKLLIEKLKNVAMSAGCYKIILDCDDDKVPFYEHCGLKRKGNFMALYFD